MIEETALVLEVTPHKALLQTLRKAACESCSVKAGCGTSSLAKVVGKRSSQFTVDNTLNLNPGDQVVVAIEENALVQGSLLMYLLPLLMMLGFGMLADTVFGNELVTILSTAMGLFVSIVVARFVLAVSGLKASFQPHLIRRIP